MGRLSLSPPQVVAGGFILLIVLGSVLLATPWATNAGESDWLTAVFTATSAVCVTGLIVEDTATYWSLFGQIVIMCLMQLGGLSIMAMATFYALLFGKRIALRQRMFMQAAVNKPSPGGIVNLFRHLIFFTLGIELIATVILALHWAPQLGGARSHLFLPCFTPFQPLITAASIYSAISPTTAFSSDVVTNLVISILIIAGLGFVVIAEIISFKNRQRFSCTARSCCPQLQFLLIGTVFIFCSRIQSCSAGNVFFPASCWRRIFTPSPVRLDL